MYFLTHSLVAPEADDAYDDTIITNRWASAKTAHEDQVRREGPPRFGSFSLVLTPVTSILEPIRSVRLASIARCVRGMIRGVSRGRMRILSVCRRLNRARLREIHGNEAIVVLFLE